MLSRSTRNSLFLHILQSCNDIVSFIRWLNNDYNNVTRKNLLYAVQIMKPKEKNIQNILTIWQAEIMINFSSHDI